MTLIGPVVPVIMEEPGTCVHVGFVRLSLYISSYVYALWTGNDRVILPALTEAVIVGEGGTAASMKKFTFTSGSDPLDEPSS